MTCWPNTRQSRLDAQFGTPAVAALGCPDTRHGLWNRSVEGQQRSSGHRTAAVSDTVDDCIDGSGLALRRGELGHGSEWAILPARATRPSRELSSSCPLHRINGRTTFCEPLTNADMLEARITSNQSLLRLVAAQGEGKAAPKTSFIDVQKNLVYLRIGLRKRGPISEPGTVRWVGQSCV